MLFRIALAAGLLTGCLGSDSPDPGGTDCAESAGRVSDAIGQVASRYGECSVDADCELVPVVVTGDGSSYTESCPIVVTASRSEEFQRVAAEEAAVYAVPGCQAVPSCLRYPVVCAEGTCGLGAEPAGL